MNFTAPVSIKNALKVALSPKSVNSSIPAFIHSAVHKHSSIHVCDIKTHSSIHPCVLIKIHSFIHSCVLIQIHSFIHPLCVYMYKILICIYSHSFSNPFIYIHSFSHPSIHTYSLISSHILA